jgi:nucleoside-diphosphate-sugar epimerase
MAPHVLLIGGTGQLGREILRVMLSRSWSVTVSTRSKAAIDYLSAYLDQTLDLGIPRNIGFVILDFTKPFNAYDAAKVIRTVRPTAIVWTASGGGGMFGDEVFRVDRDAVRAFIDASLESGRVTKFLNISTSNARRKPAHWWTELDTKAWISEITSYPDICQAKLEADEHLAAASQKAALLGQPFQAISLRPYCFSNGPPTGKIQIGKTSHIGTIAKGDVALTVVELLARNDSSGWFDVVGGHNSIREAVQDAVQSGVNCMEGEPSLQM